MNFSLELPDEAIKMGKTARAFFEKALPEDIRQLTRHAPEIIPIETQKRWHRILADRGWGGHGLPKKIGGTGWDDEVYYAFLREMALADAPRPMLYGLRMLATTLVKFGTPEQKQRHLPGILSGEVMWCQAFSEPNAGSDLASLKCSAVRDGNDYIINGAKIWITEAHWSDALFGIFRTSKGARKQEGITLLMMPTKTAGIEVRPLTLLDGVHEINEVIFRDVRVSASDRLGDEGDGWRIAKYLLSTERLELAEVGRSWSLIARIKKVLARNDEHSRTLLANEYILLKLAELEIRLLALDATERRLLLDGPDALRAAAPILKIDGTILSQDLAEFLMDICGPSAQKFSVAHDLNPAHAFNPPEAQYSGRLFYNSRVRTIYGGSTETMRNIIARDALQPDR